MDFFTDLSDIRRSFKRFSANTLPDGVLILNSAIDAPEEITAGLTPRVVFFGTNGNEDYTAADITFDARACARFTCLCHGSSIGTFTLSVPGMHNASNALAAIAFAKEAGLADAAIQAGLSSFGGTARRFEYKGSRDGITVIDDYAHHPTEIRATLTAARSYSAGRIVCVFQPHTYTRTKAFWADFVDALSLADVVVLADVYAARETDTLGVDCRVLSEEIALRGCESTYFPTFPEIVAFLEKNSLNNDLLITMGAGDVYKIGESFLTES